MVKQNFHLYSVVLKSSPNTEKKILFTPEITLTSWFWLLIQYLKYFLLKMNIDLFYRLRKLTVGRGGKRAEEQ